MKKYLILILTLCLFTLLFTSCGEQDNMDGMEDRPQTNRQVTINVVTSYGGDDGNRKNYEEAYRAYEKATGNKVLDASETSNEEWKAKINTDFETGSESDVLFYFNGTDANKIIEKGKVVSIEEIRSVYPEYASNMKDELLGASPLDNKNYSVPVNGYWEALFVNKKVLADCGLPVPDENTTWDEFVSMCKSVLEKGYTPIAASIQEVPHYWFEYAVFNNGNLTNHSEIPASAEDAVGMRWTAGLEDIKYLYENNFFPKNTLTSDDAETFQLLLDGKAAFAIDGSWKIGHIETNAMNVDDFTVTFVPGKNERATTELIGGLSMGYYITRKAWDNPEKREACVKFVEMMTTDEVVSKFGAVAVTALKNGTMPPENATSLTNAALEMTKKATGVSPATQDGLSPEQRNSLFSDVKNVVTGKIAPTEAIENFLSLE